MGAETPRIRGRQTLLPEWTDPNVTNVVDAFPYLVSTRIVDDVPGRKTHLARRDDMMGDIGDTLCGRWLVKAVPIESELEALQATNDLCGHCRMRLATHELELLAALATANSQHEITPEDI